VENTPNYEAIEQAEAVAVRVALERGYLRTQQLREALLLREQLRVAGRQTRLLQLLGARYIPLEHQAELSQVYFAALSDPYAFGKTPDELPSPPPEDMPASAAQVEQMLASSADELAIPEFMLSASSEQLQRPAEEDPDAVMEFMARSSEITASSPPASEADTGALPPTRQAVSRKRAENPEADDHSESGLWRWLRKHLPG
jgi:hypothetical protein